MKYQKMIRTAQALLLIIPAVCLGGCSVSLGGFSLGNKEELEFSCREELPMEEAEGSSEMPKEAEEKAPPAPEEASASGAALEGGIAADGRVDINKAGVEELMTLNGIGETRAKAIVEYRTQNGPFTKEEDLMLIPGIKEGIYSKIRDQIIVY